MDNQQRDRILAAISLTGATEQDEAFCDETQANLAFYIELEQGGEHVEQAYPAIARHLQVCPDCRAEYLSLRQIMADYGKDALPTEEPDLQLLPLPTKKPDLQLLPPPPEPAVQPESDPKGWRPLLRQLAGARRQRGELSQLAVRVPALGADVQLHLRPVLDGDDAILTGYFTPPQRALRGRIARLYTVVDQTEFDTVLQAETVLEEFGNTSFAPLRRGIYVLTLDLPAGEVPVVMLGEKDWQEV